MTLPSYAFGNPEKVAMRNEQEKNRKEQACGQCRERDTAQWGRELIIFCGVKNQIYGRRCEHFRKKTTKGEE